MLNLSLITSLDTDDMPCQVMTFIETQGVNQKEGLEVEDEEDPVMLDQEDSIFMLRIQFLNDLLA